MISTIDRGRRCRRAILFRRLLNEAALPVDVRPSALREKPLKVYEIMRRANE